MSQPYRSDQRAARKTEQPRPRLPDGEQIKNAIIRNGLMMSFCQKYMPGGRVDGSDWRCASRVGGKGNRVTMGLWGKNAGVGIEWPIWPGEGSGFDIIAVIRDSCGLLPSEAMAKAREESGLPIEAFAQYAEPEQTPEQKQRDAEQKARDVASALRTWNECVDIIGTPAEGYLRHRGVTRSLPMSLRFHPKLGYWERVKDETDPDGKSKWKMTGEYPALVGKVQRSDGAFCGIHRIYLAEAADPDTGEVYFGKALVGSPKKVWGDVLGGFILCCDEEEFAGKVGICEGIEDACCVPDVYDGMPAVAAVSASGVRGIVLPDYVYEPVFLPDNDPPKRDREGNVIIKDGKPIYAGLDAATAAVNRLRSETCSPRIQKVRGPTGKEKDVNAVLLAEKALNQKATA